MESSMIETVRNQITLPEESPKLFESFIKWLYTGDVAVADGVIVCHDSLDFYILADKWCIEQLKNAITDSVKEFHKGVNMNVDYLSRMRDVGCPEVLWQGTWRIR